MDLDLSIDPSRLMGQDKNRQGVSRRAFRIGAREGTEAKEDGDYSESPPELQDMAQGILENAGLIQDGTDEGRVQAMVSAFVNGWKSVNSQNSVTS